MKPHRQAPKDSFQIVRPDDAHQHYEVWVLKSVCLGSMDRLAKHIVTDDKVRFVNITDATQHLIDRASKCPPR